MKPEALQAMSDNTLELQEYCETHGDYCKANVFCLLKQYLLECFRISIATS